MADRAVSVRLMAKVDQYKAGMADAANATKRFGSDTVAHTKSASQGLASVQTQSTIVGASLLGMAGMAVITAAKFDKAMSGVAAVSGATASQMDQLRQAALDAGQATVYSASEAAQAEAELAKAGVKTADILGGALTGALSLAAAGQIGLADAATIAAQAMNIFKLKGSDVGHIADVLAAGANKSAADVQQLGDALRQGGLVAAQTGLSFDETTAALSAFADRGLVGADAGTSLKSMLQRLVPQSKMATNTMDALGITAFDASGKFVGLAQYAQTLQDALKPMSDEQKSTTLSILYGSDAVRGASVLYSLGAKGVNDYTAAVNDTGAANRMAAVQLDNLAGDYEQLSGSIETAFIKSGSTANGMLRTMTQLATGAVNVIGDLPTPILAVATGVTALSGAFLIAAPRIVAVNAALAASPGLARAASAGFAALGPLVAVAALASLVTSEIAANNAAVDLDNSVKQLTADMGKAASADHATALAAQITALENQLDNPGFGDQLVRGMDAINNAAAGLWGGAGGNTSHYEEQLAQLKKMQDEFEQYRAVVEAVAAATGTSMGRAQELITNSGVGLTGSLNDTTQAVLGYVKMSGEGSVASQKASDALGVLSDSTASAKDSLKALGDEWNATTGSMLGASDATIAAEAALDAMTKSIKDNGKSFDIHTEKGRANQSALNDSISSFEALREKLVETGAATEAQANKKMVGYLTTLRNSLPASAKGARAELQSIIDKYAAIPANKTAKVTVTVAGGAVADINAISRAIRKLPGHVGISINANGTAHGTGGAATGGLIRGAGTKTSDSVAMRLSRGEFVQQASAVDKYGPAFMHAVNAGTYRPASGGGAAQVLVGGSGVPVIVQIGEQQLVSALLRFKRGNGGLELGIA